MAKAITYHIGIYAKVFEIYNGSTGLSYYALHKSKHIAPGITSDAHFAR